MNAFLIELDNKVSELARVTEAIAAKGVDIKAVSGSTCGTSGSVAVITDNEATTRAALEAAKAKFREIEVIEAPVGMAQGSLAKVARRLADAGVNLEALLPIGMSGNDVMIAFVTRDAAKAKSILTQAGATSR